MKVDPKDSSLYYITYIPGNLYQITYSTGIKVPIANASSDVTQGTSPLTVHFSSSGSSDPNGLSLTYKWDFGDGTTSTDPNPTKVYNTNGKYTVQLTVNNGTYTALAVPFVMQVGTPPTVTVSSPINNATYKAGDVITYTASAKDAAGNTIADSSISTTIVFHHQTHIHPFLGPIPGHTGQFTIPNTGEVSADTWYEIDMTATDSNGLTSTSVVNIYPQKVNMTFASNVSGAGILLDSQPLTTPTTVQGVVNFLRVINAPMLQVVNGVSYSFHGWSDNGAVRHTITTPSTDTTFTATFDQTTPFTGQYFTNMTLSGTPVLTRHDPQINFDWQTTSPDPSIPLTQYSVRWTKQQYFPAGRYTFTTASDDGNRLYVDNNLVIDDWKDQALTANSKDVDLTNGNHDIRMEFYQNMGGSLVSLKWEYSLNQPTNVTPTPTQGAVPTPTPTVAVNQKLGGMDLNGYCTSIGITTGATLTNGSWYCGTSTTAIDMTKACQWQYNTFNTVAQQDRAGDPYSWSCYATAGTPTATPTPTKIPATPTPTKVPPTPTPTLTPTPTVSASGYTGKYWNLTTTVFPPTIPTITPTLTRTDLDINFTWNNGSPDPKITVDNFAAQWTKTQNFVAGTYRFTTQSDDGIRVYIDNSVIIDQWNDHALLSGTADKTLTAGNHTIRVDYYEHSGGAIAKFSFVKL